MNHQELHEKLTKTILGRLWSFVGVHGTPDLVVGSPAMRFPIREALQDIDIPYMILSFHDLTKEDRERIFKEQKWPNIWLDTYCFAFRKGKGIFIFSYNEIATTNPP